MNVSTKLITWYQHNKRDLPWRHTRDPYKIWLSEIILQQTQVKQGLHYYLNFVNTFPKVKQLAKAPEDQVLKLWQGLGYYSRARNLHHTAKTLVKEYAGIFPANYEQIKSLKGIGDYTAAAISSFAFDLPHAVLDGNVYRFLSRLFAIETPIDASSAKKEFSELADRLLDKKQPALFNQAIMEFGSQYCKKSKPDCPQCIFKTSCLAWQTGNVEKLPLKTKKTKVTKRFLHYLVLLNQKNEVYIQKRTQNDIWKGLYEFYLIETPKTMSLEDLLEHKEVKNLYNKKIQFLKSSKTYRHKLSHQLLEVQFYVLNLNSRAKKTQGIWVNAPKLSKHAFPRLIEKFMDDGGLKEIF